MRFFPYLLLHCVCRLTSYHFPALVPVLLHLLFASHLPPLLSALLSSSLSGSHNLTLLAKFNGDFTRFLNRYATRGDSGWTQGRTIKVGIQGPYGGASPFSRLLLVSDKLLTLPRSYRHRLHRLLRLASRRPLRRRIRHHLRRLHLRRTRRRRRQRPSPGPLRHARLVVQGTRLYRVVSELLDEFGGGCEGEDESQVDDFASRCVVSFFPFVTPC